MDSFWSTLPKPIVGLSAMDGVTDAAMRQMTALLGRPDLMMTEFTSVDGITHGVTKLLRDLYYQEEQRPIIAQLFGATPEHFRTCAVIVCELGFDGVDINMGCPAPSVAERGSGAALIREPELAQAIIRATKQGVQEWTEGRSLEDLDLPQPFKAAVAARMKRPDTRVSIPVSVKTRIGYDHDVVSEWIPTLLETEPVTISLHGRTLEQLYAGQADWDAIGRAAEIVHQTKTLILGNGDITSPEMILPMVQTYGVDGVLIGRAARGNPWFFSQWRAIKEGTTYTDPTPQERLASALRHAQIFEETNATAFSQEPLPFFNMRKHFGWYVREMPGASEIRAQMFQTQSLTDVRTLLETLSDAHRSVTE